MVIPTFRRTEDVAALLSGLFHGTRPPDEVFVVDNDPGDAVPELHKVLGGRANIGFLSAAGELLVFNAYPQNRMWRFRSGEAEVAATELHSSDDSLFDLVFPEATDRRRVSGVEAVTVGVDR